MPNTIRNGHSLDVTIPIGQSVAITTYTGTYSASVLYGLDKGTVLATASEGGDTFGPYASGAVIRITAGVDSEVAFDVGASPSVTASQKAPTFAVDAVGNVTGLVGPDGSTISIGGSSELPYDTVSLSATTAAIRSAPCQVAGFTCTASTSLNINLYANSANSGTLIWSGALTTGQVVTFPAPYSSFLGLSLQIASGSGTISIQVR